MSFQDQLSLKGKLKDLPTVIEFVESACSAAGVNPDRQFDIVLAIEEAASNVFEHAYRGKAGQLTIRLAAVGADLHVTLIDTGRSFDPTAIASPDTSVPLEERPVGGLGMHLMHKLMDEVSYTFAPDGNTLIMVARGVLPNHAGPADSAPAVLPDAGLPRTGLPGTGLPGELHG